MNKRTEVYMNRNWGEKEKKKRLEKYNLCKRNNDYRKFVVESDHMINADIQNCFIVQCYNAKSIQKILHTESAHLGSFSIDGKIFKNRGLKLGLNSGTSVYQNLTWRKKKFQFETETETKTQDKRRKVA